MEPTSYMQSVVHWNVVTRRVSVLSPNFLRGTEVNHDKHSWTTFEVATDILTRQSHDSEPPQARSLARSDPRPVFALVQWQSESCESAFHI